MKFFKINYKTLKIIGGGTISVLAMVLVMLLPSCNKNPMEPLKNIITKQQTHISPMSDFLTLHYQGTEVYYYRHATERCWKWWPPGWYSVYYYTLYAKVSFRVTAPRNARVKVKSGYFTPFDVHYSTSPTSESCNNCYMVFVKRSCDDPSHGGYIRVRIAYYDARGAKLKDIWSNRIYKNYRYGYGKYKNVTSDK